MCTRASRCTPASAASSITQGNNASAVNVLNQMGGGLTFAGTIDATKAGEVLRTLGGGIDDYFGTGQVTQALADSGKVLTPHVASYLACWFNHPA